MITVQIHQKCAPIQELRPDVMNGTEQLIIHFKNTRPK